MKVTEGYQIKVTENTHLNISGQPIGSSLDVPLTNGWNIIGYPYMSGQSTSTVFGPMKADGTLLKVQDEAGNPIENVTPIGWIDEIHNLLPGKGYHVRTNVNTVLSLNDPGKGVMEYIRSNDKISNTLYNCILR